MSIPEFISDKSLTLHGVFEAQVEKTPEAIALVFEQEQLTYRELNERANQLAHYLRSLNVDPEMLVGIYLERSIEMIVGMLGILKAGGAFVPLDPSQPQERLAFILADTKVEVLLTLKKLVAGIPVPQGHLVCLDAECENIATKSKNNPKSGVQSDNLAYTIYTSGSTGQPKGVMVNHQAICQGFLWMQEIFPITQQDRILQKLPLTFDFSFWELFWPLITGACVVLAQPGGEKDSAYLVKLIVQQEISILVFVPSVLQVFLSEKGLKTCKNIRMVFTGGEPLTSTLKARFFNQLPNCQLYDLFGATENIVVTYWPCQPEEKLSSFPQGRPFPNLSIYVVDEQLQPVPVGETGELLVGGWGLARGYLNRPELTAQKFIFNPFKDKIQKRFYRTGDIVRYLSDGTIEILGRIDNQVKIRGFRIELGEIEEKLSQHPGVKQVAVIAREDVAGDKRLVAYVVLHSSQESEPNSISDLRHFLKQQLPDYMIPSGFVVLEALPLSPNGKVDRRALPVPEIRPADLPTFVAPRTPIEEMLASIWANILRVELVGIHDNFFTLGGDSLLAVQIIARMCVSLGVELSFSRLLEFPTVEGLALIVEEVRQQEQRPIGISLQPMRHINAIASDIPPLEKVERTGDLPLSFAQEQMWFLSQLSPDNPFYNELETLQLKGYLNIVALEKSLNYIVQRHEVLRTNFATFEGRPVQVIADSLTLMMPVVDLTELPKSDRKIASQQLAMAKGQRPFNLANEPLIRATLLKLTEVEHVLLLTMHHIVYDGWSQGVLFQELKTSYSAFCNNLSPELPSLPIQCADFAIWQRQWLQGDVLQSQLSYWLQQLANAPALSSLPTDRPRPAVQIYRGAYQEFALSKELSVALKQLSQKENVTLFMTLLATFQTLLWRYSGQDDVCIGTPIANRNHAEIEGLIGFFVDTLVLRTRLDGNPSFKQLLSRVREVALGAYSHQDLPFEMLVEALQPERNLGHNAIFQVWFNLLNFSDIQLELSGLSVEPISMPGAASKFDISLYVKEQQHGIQLELVYNSDLFNADTIAKMLLHYQTLLESIVANPEQQISTLPLLTETERYYLKSRGNVVCPSNPFITFDKQDIEQSIPDRFHEQVRKYPHHIAVQTKNYHWTYSELNCRANQVAQAIGLQCTFGAEKIALLFEHDAPMVAAILGVLQVGKTYVPLDPNYPSDRVVYILEDSGASAVLTNNKNLTRAQELTQGIIPLINIDDISFTGSYNEVKLEISPDTIAYILYTSGSTGQPKGVIQNHRNVLHFIKNYTNNLHINEQDGLTLLSSYSFDAAIMDIFAAILNGATLYPVNIKEEGLTQLSQLLQQHHITIYHSTPTLYRHFVSTLREDEKLSKIRLVVLGGEEVVKTDVDLYKQHFSDECIFVNGLGPTESTVTLQYFINKQTEITRNTVPVGYPVEETEIFLLNEADEKTDIYGEIAIRSPYIALGYWQKHNLTQAVFLPDPECGSRRIYRTGDMGRIRPDGSIEFSGRKDFQVKIRGFRIELGEIEAAIAQHPSIRETVVIATEDVPGNKHLVAYVVLTEMLTTEELRHILRRKLPEYMIPSSFVFLDSLPLTPNGKIDRRALPAPQLHRESDKFAAPRTPIEEMLAYIWASVLKVEQVGIHHNFFELGGHSLLATQLISRIRSSLKVELPLRSLFAAATVAQLAQEIGQWQQQQLELTCPPLLPTPRNVRLPLSFAQQRLWFLDQLKPNSAFYNIPRALRLQGQLQLTALEQSLREIIHRHEALRTNFITVDGQPTQIIHPETTWMLSIVDWQHLPTTEQQIAAQQLASSLAQQPFDLASEALFRATLVVLNQTEHILLVCMHHIVSDRWSIGVFVQELAALYNAFCQGQPSPLAPLPVQYADFTIWQRQWLQEDVLQTQLAYWQQQLKDAPALLLLPTDRPRPAMQTFSGAYLTFALSRELTGALTQLSQQQGVTLFMTLLAAFDTLLYRYTGQSDILVGSPIANRNLHEIEGLIGFFVNTLVMRTDVSGNPTFEELLIRVRSTAIDAYAHQDLPFEMLVEALQPERDLSHTPLFQVAFVLQNTPMSQLELTGLSVSSLPTESATAKFDLTLGMENTATGLVGWWEYNTDLFDASTIERMNLHFVTLLEGIVANPIQQISQLPLLTESEQRQLLVEWNDTQVDYPLDKCIHKLFEEQVERSPDAIAVVFEDKQLTYQELNQQANQLAHYLQSLGVGSEVLVGICVERSLEMVVGLLGILKAGGAYVPLDPTYPQERLAFMLEDASVPVLLLAQTQLVESLPNHQAFVICLDTDWEAINRENKENTTSDVTADNLAYVIYTSGSTGKPKGVAVSHRAVNRLLFNTNYIKIEPFDRVAQASNASFDAVTFEIWGALLHGARLVGISKDVVLSPRDFAAHIRKREISVLFLTTALFNQLASVVPQAFNSVRYLLFGGEAVDPRWVKEVLRNGSPQRLLHVYGPTESTTFSSWYLMQEVPEGVTTLPIGRPISNTQIYLLDRNLQPVPIGVTGEVYIGGDGLAQGYLNRPDLTAEKFIPNPWSNEPGSRLYKTGDKARYLPDGNIEYLGRIDHQVKIRGFRIELGEIEAAIALNPAVQQTLIIAREDIPGHKYLVAYIVPNHSSALASSNLRGFLKEKLPAYMIPGVFVMLDALPLTPNGKVDRKALPIPDTARQELQADLVAPRTRFEEILAQIWREVFHQELFSIHDNFFELGGDSILSIQIIFKANIAGLLLTPKQIFQHQTIAELAAVATTPETRKAEQGLVTGSLPLTPIQHWFFAQNLREPHHFNQAFLLEVPPTINPDLLQQALQQLLLHHDALRLRFNQSEACWQQFNALPDETVPFSLIDLSTLQEFALSQTIESTSDLLQVSLNLNSGPLLRVALFHLGTQKPSRLLLVIHHLAVDGVSWRILLEDLQTAYQQLESGKPIQLPAKTTSFKHWAEKLTQYAQSPTATKELTYWSNISTPKITRFPVDCNQGANTKASARSVNVSLNSEETRALLQEIHKAYHTQINDILLTALVQVLATWSGCNSILINLEGHGREEILPDVDLSRTVGWFTTIFPVLLELKATENLGDAIKSIKEQLRAIPNRGIGYGLLRYLSGDAEITSQLSSSPQAEVSFNYLGQFDWGMQSDSFVKLASESVGSERSQLGQRSHLLEINGLVVENQLQLSWTYSENFHSSATIESLAQDFVARLRTLIAHCLSTDAGGYTPDVFENQTIYSEAQPINNDQRRENNVSLPLHLLELPEEISELLPSDTESAYPIAKMQEFMLHHYVNDPHQMGVYHCQQSYDIYDESLDLNAFKKALEISVQKHPVLRTVFITSNGKPVIQVVKKNLRFSIKEQDISHLKSQEQSNYIDAVMKQDRQNLFDVENPNEPLYRFRIFQKAENRFEFLMSIHHAINDGWGNIEFLNELYEIYSALKKGEEITVVPALYVYKEFVALEKEIIGSLSASNFWKLHLKDYTYKPLKPLTTSVEQVEAVAEEYNFDSQIIADVLELCRKLGVSPKAPFLSTYLDLIGTVMKENRVCVGIISNGRTERLSDPFGALGLFWNIVPFCQPTREDKGVQIKNVQQSLIDIEPYVRYPLLQILSDQQKPELFFATFNFVHFHNAKNLNADTGLKVNARKSHDKFNFPLNYAISMEPSSGNVSIRVEYDQMYFSSKDIRSMIQNYIEILKHTAHTSELY